MGKRFRDSPATEQQFSKRNDGRGFNRRSVRRMLENDGGKMEHLYDVAILGAGSAGLSALRAVRRKTENFIVVNAGAHGTTCARNGCMPSKALNAAHESVAQCPSFCACPATLRSPSASVGLCAPRGDQAADEGQGRARMAEDASSLPARPDAAQHRGQALSDAAGQLAEAPEGPDLARCDSVPVESL
jgi:hypothetical protein